MSRPSLTPPPVLALLLACSALACDDLSSEPLDSVDDDQLRNKQPPPATFTTLAQVLASTPVCSSDFSGPLDGCYDPELPPAPTIRRSFIPARGDHPDVVAGVSSRRPEQAFLTQTDGQISDLPPHRATADGRVSTTEDQYGNPTLEMFFPENLDYGGQIANGRAAYGGAFKLPWTTRYFPPLTSQVPWSALNDDTLLEQAAASQKAPLSPDDSPIWADLDLQSKPEAAPVYNWDLCDGDQPDPEPCSLIYTKQWGGITGTPYGSWTPWQGQCYQTTLLYTHQFSGADHNMGNQWELRSVDVTVFAGSRDPGGATSGPMRLPDPTTPNVENQVMVLPRAAYDAAPTVGNGKQLHYDAWDIDRALIKWNADHCQVDDSNPPQDMYGVCADNFVVEKSWVTFATYLKMIEDECLGQTPEPWCAWGEAHEVRRGFEMLSEEADVLSWDGEFDPYDYPSADFPVSVGLLEPSTTEDGKVLAMHVGGTIRYSYSDDACSARGFRRFQSISAAYVDPDLHDANNDDEPLYGFAAEPIRLPNGDPVTPYVYVRGSYPWISSGGEVLMWPMLDSGFGWRPQWVSTGDQVGPSQLQRNSAAVVAAGSWTRGKIVHVDNMLNFSNFQGADWPNRLEVMKLRLYADDDVYINPRGTFLLNSTENSLNHLEAVSPIAPFDVVWPMSSSAHHTAEMIFDDYMHPRAWVVGHMNESLSNLDAWGSYTDGFAGGFDAYQNWIHGFAGTPTLQNASTVLGAPELRLRGGAFVPPVAEGGVIGKGVFLDGRNDHVTVDELPAGIDDFMASVWIEYHAADKGQSTLLTFADGSVLALEPFAVEFHAADGSTAIWNRPLAYAGPRFTHFAVAVYTDATGVRRMRVYEDGDSLGEQVVSGALISRASVDAIPCASPDDHGFHCSGDGMYSCLCNVVEGPGGLLGYECATAPAETCAAGCGELGGNQAMCLEPRPALVVGTDGGDAIGLPPVRGWVDELRVYGLDRTTVAGVPEWDDPFFGEWVCNRALGSVRHDALSNTDHCQQLDFRHSDPNVVVAVPGQMPALPTGTGLDFHLDAYQSQSCANQAHREADPDCARADRLGLPDLVLGQERPEMRYEPFCRTCHLDVHAIETLEGEEELWKVPGLAVENDQRRQPMMWPTGAGYAAHVGDVLFGQPNTTAVTSTDAPMDLDAIVLQWRRAPPR